MHNLIIILINVYIMLPAVIEDGLAYYRPMKNTFFFFFFFVNIRAPILKDIYNNVSTANVTF